LRLEHTTFRGRRCLITGGAGFIGSALARRLAALNCELIILDNLSTGKIDNLRSVASSLRVIEGDVRDEKLAERLVAEVDYVFHLAAIPSVPRSVENPQATLETNVKGTLTLLEAAKKTKVKRIIFASSSSVYGNDPAPAKVEDRVGEPLSPYAVSKRAAESLGICFTKLFEVPFVSLRFFNVFGPRQDPMGQYAAVIPLFITKMLAEKSPVIHGDGEQTRDFTFVENVVDANLLAATHDQAIGEIFNVGCGNGTTINELYQILSRLAEREMVPRRIASRQGDVRHSIAQIQKIVERLGYSPQVSVEDGLRQTVAWFKEQR